VAGGVAGEEDAVLDGRSQLVGDPVALVADGVDGELVGEPERAGLDVVARLERADPDA
jgi:hypothetical protein